MITYSGYRLSGKQQRLLDLIATYALDSMASTRLINTLDINVIIRKGLLESEGIHGDCTNVDEEISPKEFDVRLDYPGVANSDELFTTFIHELVHVVQYAQRRLRHLNDGFTRFEKRRFSPELSYEFQPWEREAAELEYIIFEKILNDIPEVADYIHKKVL